MAFIGTLSFILMNCSGPRMLGGGEKGDVGKLCRSCSPYNIKGWWYYPQKDYHYDEEGIASWYGPGFHGKLKAQGQTYNMHALSAAHKTLPLPTVVKVTNLTNGRSVNLVIDDRGPYVGDRIIDLSVAAAKRLGTYRQGLCRVRVQALPSESRALSNHLRRMGGYKGHDPRGRSWQRVYEDDIKGKCTKDKKQAPLHKKSTKTTSIIRKTLGATLIPTHHYFVKLGAFLHKKNAQAFKDDLRGIAHVVLEPSKLSSGQQVYVVSAGPYTDKSLAQNAQLFFNKAGYKKTHVVCIESSKKGGK